LHIGSVTPEKILIMGKNSDQRHDRPLTEKHRISVISTTREMNHQETLPYLAN
jgi:hypothetical protein